MCICMWCIYYMYTYFTFYITILLRERSSNSQLDIKHNQVITKPHWYKEQNILGKKNSSFILLEYICYNKNLKYNDTSHQFECILAEGRFVFLFNLDKKHIIFNHFSGVNSPVGVLSHHQEKGQTTRQSWNAGTGDQ